MLYDVLGFGRIVHLFIGLPYFFILKKTFVTDYTPLFSLPTGTVLFRTREHYTIMYSDEYQVVLF
jgi:hypothetical protein